MKLAHYFFREPFDWNNQYIHTLVIENPMLYRNFISGMIEQQSVMDGMFVLSNDNEIIDFHKNVELITDIFRVSPSENKKIINAIQKELTDIANHDFPHELSELYCKIHALLSDTVFSCGMDITFDEINDITPIIKLYNVRPDIEDHSLLGRLLIYMELCEKYLKKKLFIILNLHSCCSQEELDCFFKDIVYRKNNILLLETHLEDASKYEKVLIVDKDMCEI